jgi:hypothetical protein
MSHPPLVTGVFRDRDSAERAYLAVYERGYGRDDVNLLMSDDTRRRHFGAPGGPAPGPPTSPELGTKAAEGAGIGGAIGGTLGAIAAAIAAIGTTVLLPGLGVVVAGPVAAALVGAGAGGAAGGLVGALIGWGLPEERVRQYERAVRDGGILLGVRTRNETDAEHFERSWRDANGELVAR